MFEKGDESAISQLEATLGVEQRLDAVVLVAPSTREETDLQARDNEDVGEHDEPALAGRRRDLERDGADGGDRDTHVVRDGDSAERRVALGDHRQ
eukprot:scaffold1496_cov110-Isochrysis_galbana.AAC.1